MKYLVIGPGGMGIFTLVGYLKRIENQLVDVKEISGSSAGAIISLFLSMGMSIDEIYNNMLSVDISKLVKMRLGSFFSKFGLIDLEPIRKKLINICGKDPTFNELNMTIFISAFCLNTGETVYFSKNSHPDMKVIDAVCMSMAIPLIFTSIKYQEHTYVDGATKEHVPLSPFIDKKVHEITCLKLNINSVYRENINNPKEYLECLVRSSLQTKPEYNNRVINTIEIDIDETTLFNFNMSYEDKIKLFNIGYSSRK